MLKEVFKIDENGFILDHYPVEFDEQGKPVKELADNIITVQPPSFHKSKWDGTKWIEAMTEQEYIATLSKPPQQAPTEQQQLNAQMLLENANLKTQVAEQQKLNASVLLEVAKLKGGA